MTQVGMTIDDMLGQSLILTGLGMAVVFAFLIIMILCMYGSSALIRGLKLDRKGKNEKDSGSANSTKNAVQNEEETVAAIAAAVHDKQLH